MLQPIYKRFCIYTGMARELYLLSFWNEEMGRDKAQRDRTIYLAHVTSRVGPEQLLDIRSEHLREGLYSSLRIAFLVMKSLS